MPLGTEGVAGVSASVGPMTRHVHALVPTLSATSTPSLWSTPFALARCRVPNWSRPRSPGRRRSTQTSTAWPTRTSTRHWRLPTRIGRMATSPGCQPFQGQRRCRGHADDAGQRRLRAAPQIGPRRVRPIVPGDRARAGGQDPTVGVRVECLGGTSAARRGAQPWDTDYTAGASSSGSGRSSPPGGADRTRERRRRVDPNSGRLQRIGRSQALARPASVGLVAAADAGEARHQRRAHPLGARHRRVLPGSRTHLA